MPTYWTKFEVPFDFSGGGCSVGFTIKDAVNSEFWWAASAFNLNLVSLYVSQNINNISSISLTSFPNPFSNKTTLSFKFPDSENNVKLEIFNKDGLLVKSFTESKVVANKLYNYKFCASKKDGQIFIVRLVTSNKVQTLKLIKTE
jgi:hypothetical protein